MSAADRWAREPRAVGPTERTLVETGVVVEHTLDDDEVAQVPTRRLDTADPRRVALVPAEPGRERDLDQIQELAWSVVGALIYLFCVAVGFVALTMSFALWVACAAGLFAGALPAGYTLRKSAQRRGEKERHTRLLEAQEQSAGSVDLPDFP